MMRPGIFGAAGAEFHTHVVNVGSQASADALRQTDALQFDVEKLFMITEALWDILKEKHGYDDEDLVRMVQDIDLRDGNLDGKVAKQPNPPCQQCDRTLVGEHPVCLYCGAVNSRAPFER